MLPRDNSKENFRDFSVDTAHCPDCSEYKQRMINMLKNAISDLKERSKLFALAFQFVKFGIVGVCNAIVMLSVYYLILWINKDLYILGNILGYMCGILCSYLLNSRFVFKADGGAKHSKTSIIKVYISYGITLLLQTVLLYVMVNYLSINEHIAPLINICITTPVNFLLNKCWAFRIKNKEKQGEE